MVNYLSPALLLHSAQHYAGYEVLLQERIYDQHRHHGDKHLGRIQRPVGQLRQLLILLGGQIGADRNVDDKLLDIGLEWIFSGGVHQHQPVKELVPVINAKEQRHCGKYGDGTWDVHPKQDRPWTGAVDYGRLMQLLRQVAEEVHDQDHVEYRYASAKHLRPDRINQMIVLNQLLNLPLHNIELIEYPVEFIKRGPANPPFFAIG